MNDNKQLQAIQAVKEGKNTLITGVAGCVDKETEFLSPDGWIKISEWSGQKVAQVSEYGLEMSFVEPLDYIAEPCDYFYTVDAPRGINQWLSKEHNVAYTVKDKLKLNKKCVTDVVSIGYKNKAGFCGKIPCVFNYDKGVFDKDWSETLIRLAVAIKADGSLVTESTGRYRLNIKRPRKIERLEWLLAESGLEYIAKDGYTEGYRLYLVNFPECNKRLEQFWMCDKKTAEVVLDELQYWDGSLDSRTGLLKYFTTDKSDADTCQLLATMCGFKANINTCDRRGRVRKLNNKEYITKSIDYVVNLSKQTHIAVMDKNKGRLSSEFIKKPSVDGMKYCFTVPSGFLVLRREDKIFVTGNSGKTHTMRQVIPPNTIIGAPTGIAALNIGGQTLHRLFKLPIGMVTEKDFHIKQELKDLLKVTDTIVVDEIGMVRADYLDLINWKCQRARGNNLPFGGIQFVGLGDFFQLEPIVHWREKEYFQQEYDTPFCFGANCFKDFEVIELTKVYRQDNKRQVNMLNSIRKKDKNHKFAIRNINNEAKPYKNDNEVLHLCCYKADAEEINNYWYERITSKEKSYTASYSGLWKENEMPVPEVIRLKVGARVIIAANDMDGEYVNGDKGEVIALFNQDVMVKLDSGREVLVQPNKWEKHSYIAKDGVLDKEVDAEYTQLPIKLGWATTVHASQGLTLDEIAIHLGGGCFSHGQLYTALSRARDLTKVSLVNPIRYSDCIVNRDVIKFYKKLRGE